MSTSTLKQLAGCAVLQALLSSAALAQDGGWTYAVSAYGWFNDTAISTDTPQGQVDADLSFSDALDSLDFAVMGATEARNGRWGILGDLFYFKLSADASTPSGILFSDAEIESEVTALSGYLTYRVYEDPKLAFDIGAGARAFWLGLETTLVGAAAPTETSSRDKNWVDPLLAARLRLTVDKKWFGALFLDAGGTDDSQSWQALATVGYRLNENLALQGGYRYLEAEWDTQFGESSIEFSGPIIGVTYRF
jgi:opacity protein-like surface antigen